MIKVCAMLHAVPGRVRLKLAPLNLRTAEIEAKFRMIPGVTSVVCSEISGNIVVYHQYQPFPVHMLSYIDFFLSAAIRRASSAS